MAVQVYDRDGGSWTFDRGSSVVADEQDLRIYDTSGELIGGFNKPSWTHYVVGTLT